MKQSKVEILLGTNIGDKRLNLENARTYLKKYCGEIIAQSSIYESDPWGNTDQESFYNQVIVIRTPFPPTFLMNIILMLELKLGRKRQEKWGPRIIDIDMLFYGDQVINNATLKVPHPGIPERNFTLLPLVELHPNFLHPTLKTTLKELLGNSPDKLTARKL